MKIAVNGKSLNVGEPGGAVRVAHRLLAELATRYPDVTWEIFLPTTSQNSCLSLNLPNTISLYKQSCWLFRWSFFRAIWEQFIFPLSALQHSPDLMLNLTNSASICWSWDIPQVLLIHDVGFLNSQWFSRTFGAYLQWGLQRSIHQGVHLVTVSQTSATEIQATFPTLRSPIKVIWNGVDQPPQQIQPCRQDDYLLFIGSQNPRKNLAGAIAGFQFFRQQFNADIRLVVVGATKSIFTHLPNPLPMNQQVTMMGYVEDSLKWSLLKGAKLLLLPSFMEGFGLPVAEALFTGIPVVISDIPVFHELFDQEPLRNFVEYVNPASAADIAHGIRATLQRHLSTHESRPERAIALQTLQDLFTWHRAAKQYFDFFQTICS